MAVSYNKPDNNGIEKTPTGIEGFDEITRGGLPRRRTTLLIGEPGAGKTVFALQSLVNGASRWGEPGIFVAFEENSQEIIENAATFGSISPNSSSKICSLWMRGCRQR